MQLELYPLLQFDLFQFSIQKHKLLKGTTTQQVSK